MRIIDDFLPSPYEARDKGLNADWVDWLGYDGEIYRRVSLSVLPEVVDALNVAMGRPIELLGMGWRLNYAGEMPNHAVHTDAGWGRWALVLYMDTTPPAGNGTAFWKHKETDTTSMSQEAIDYRVMADWNNQGAWEMVELAEAKFNRAVIYESDKYHSRFPFEAYGSTPEDGRLIVVAFFN